MQQSEIETRCFQPAEELRFVEEADGSKHIRGLAVPYNSPSVDLGGFQEIFLPGAFGDSLRSDIFADVEHDHRVKLGRSSKRTLALTDEPRGLMADITVPKTKTGEDVAEEVRNGNLDAMSIAFSDAEDEFQKRDGKPYRIVKKATLRAVTLTAYPAYTQTAGTLALRSLEAYNAAEEAEKRATEQAEKDKAEEAKAEIERLRMRVDLELAQ